MAAIEVERLFVDRAGRTVLDGLDLRIDRGIVCIAGANGSGKSTLLGVLAGLQAHRGRVVVDGADLRTRRGRRLLASRIGYLPQDEHIEPRLTVREAVGYAAWLHRVERGLRSAHVARAIDEVGLGPWAERRVGELSGGTRRRVALAQGLVHRPPVLLLDEPTSGLDLAHRAEFRRLIGDVAQEHLVVFSSHQVEEIELMPDRVVVLDHGRAVFDGGPAALTSRGAPLAGERPVEAALRSLGVGS